MSCDGDEDEFLSEVDCYLSEECPRVNNNNRLYMAPHLVRAHSAYKDSRMNTRTHTHTHTHT